MAEELKIEMLPGTDAGKLDANYIDETEDMMELEFTPDFLEFLEHHNGGVPKKQFFNLGENTKLVERFLCLFADVQNNVEFGQFDIGVIWTQIGDRLSEFQMPFAAVYPGDFLCFDFEPAEDDEKPTVVLWIHDESYEDHPVTLPVADTFEQFLGMLTDDPGEIPEDSDEE
jgi:hypothetical protein